MKVTFSLLGNSFWFQSNIQIEVFSPVNGNLLASIPYASQTDVCPEGYAIVDLHLFRKQRFESLST